MGQPAAPAAAAALTVTLYLTARPANVSCLASCIAGQGGSRAVGWPGADGAGEQGGAWRRVRRSASRGRAHLVAHKVVVQPVRLGAGGLAAAGGDGGGLLRGLLAHPRQRGCVEQRARRGPVCLGPAQQRVRLESQRDPHTSCTAREVNCTGVWGCACRFRPPAQATDGGRGATRSWSAGSGVHQVTLHWPMMHAAGVTSGSWPPCIV